VPGGKLLYLLNGPKIGLSGKRSLELCGGAGAKGLVGADKY